MLSELMASEEEQKLLALLSLPYAAVPRSRVCERPH